MPPNEFSSSSSSVESIPNEGLDACYHMQEAKETVNDKPPVSSQGMIEEEEKKEDIFLDAEEDLPKFINKSPIGENYFHILDIP